MAHEARLTGVEITLRGCIFRSWDVFAPFHGPYVTDLPASPAALPPVIRPTIVSPSAVPERRGGVAFMSHIVRDGDWDVPRLFRSVAFMGNIYLDLTQSRIGSGRSKIEVVAFMSSVTVVVPPNVRVECDGDPIMASFDIIRETQSMTSPDSPLIEISGTAIMSSIHVKVVDPNAPKWIDRLKARLAAKKSSS